MIAAWFLQNVDVVGFPQADVPVGYQQLLVPCEARDKWRSGGKSGYRELESR